MILCSSGVFFDPQVPDVDAIVAFGPQLPVDGFEVLVTRRMIGRFSEDAQRLNDTDLRFPVVHAPKRVGAAIPDREAIGQLEETARFAAHIGASVVVLHLWDQPESDADLEGRLEAAVIATDVVTGQGLELAIETIPCHHQTPLANLERVLEHEPRAGVALDTEFLAFHDEFAAALEADWLWTDDRVRHVHLKDFDGALFGPAGDRRYLLPGDGSLDFHLLFDTLEERGFNAAVSLEAPAFGSDGAPDVETLCGVLTRMTHRPWTFR